MKTARYIASDIYFGKIKVDNKTIQQNATLCLVMKGESVYYRPVGMNKSDVLYPLENVEIICSLKGFLNSIQDSLQEEAFRDLLLLHEDNQLTYDEIQELKTIACNRKNMKAEELNKIKVIANQTVEYICDLLGIGTFAGMRTRFVDVMKVNPVVVKAASILTFKIKLNSTLLLLLLGRDKIEFYNDGKNLDVILKTMLESCGIHLTESLMINTFAFAITKKGIEYDPTKLPDVTRANVKTYLYRK